MHETHYLVMPKHLTFHCHLNQLFCFVSLIPVKDFVQEVSLLYKKTKIAIGFHLQILEI